MSEQKILITGGTSGIGLATAKLLHSRGAQVAVTGRSHASVAAARDLLPADVLVVRADAADLAETDRLVAEVGASFGSLTGLFLNAGISMMTPLATVDEATYDALFATNTKGQYFTLQKALPLLRPGASVVFTVGVGADHGIAGGSAGAGSKGAILGMIPSLALELGPNGIRVNAVSPGAISTPIWSKTGIPADMLAAVAAQMTSNIPLGRFGEGEEIASAVAFLLSDDASYITGENLVVGGGTGLQA